MFNNLTNRLNKLESALSGHECVCPPPEPAPLRPGFRVVGNQEIHLGRLACPACKGWRDVVISQVVVESESDSSPDLRS